MNVDPPSPQECDAIRRAMTPDRTAPPSPAPAYTPAWALYIYCRRGYLTYDGRLIARAVCLTPDQEARLEALYERLTRRARDRSAPS